MSERLRATTPTTRLSLFDALGIACGTVPAGSPVRRGPGCADDRDRRGVIAGYTGTQQRATYTCVGDTVNVAARLESHTKIAQRPILINENTGSVVENA